MTPGGKKVSCVGYAAESSRRVVEVRCRRRAVLVKSTTTFQPGGLSVNNGNKGKTKEARRRSSWR
jgi:hypothetical protein